MRFAVTSLLLALAVGVSAHPGEEHHHDEHAAVAKREFLEHSSRSYAACSGSERKRDLSIKVAARRAAHIEELRAAIRARKMGSNLARRQETTTLDSYGETLLNTSHASNRTDVSANITSAALYESSNSSTACLLQPDVTNGPYWVGGEYVRENITEDQQGVPIYMSTQVLDVSTCEPVQNLYWEAWHCNATGVYSGVQASGNGNYDDSSNLNATFLRGLVKTDDLGIATFQSIFPGHYTGRATHVHVIGHANATLYANGTIGTGTTADGNSTAIHVGQLFFDQDLITAVEATSPYSTNTQDITENADDSILAEEATSGASDPFFEYIYLGDSVEDGIYAWVTVGVNTTETVDTTAAAYLTPDGGVVNSDSSSLTSSGGGGGSSNSSDPSGNSTGTPQ